MTIWIKIQDDYRDGESVSVDSYFIKVNDISLNSKKAAKIILNRYPEVPFSSMLKSREYNGGFYNRYKLGSESDKCDYHYIWRTYWVVKCRPNWGEL